MSKINAIVGKCSNCTIDNANYGHYGYYMSVSNCRTPSGSNQSVCDIYINVLNKRQECLGSTSILSCLYDNPTKILNYDPNSGREIDVTNSINRGKPTVSSIPPSINPNGYIEDGRAIQSGEVAVTLLQRLARPCGEGLGDIYRDKLEPGCLPYSSTIFSNDQNNMICYDGEDTGLKTCCQNDLKCSLQSSNPTKTCNPCISIIKDVPNEPVWKDDICHYFCPSYWQQRTEFLATATEGGVIRDESDLCSDTYKTLCELAGCGPDPACKIKWGGCNYTNIDLDICNGADWQPLNRCKLGSGYCETNNLCAATGSTYTKRCKKDPIDTPPILPIVFKKNFL